MLEFLIRTPLAKGAQKFIDNLQPPVNVFIPQEIPLPSLGVVKRMAANASKISAQEPRMMALSDEQLRGKTEEFKAKIKAGLQAQENYLQETEMRLQNALDPKEREDLTIELDRARKETKKIRQKALDDVLVEAFAVVREAARRTINMRHFDVQLIGGMVLHEGRIAEMATGEGKTLVATLAAYLNALTSRGVHVVTVNDYLAKRDREWMGPIYEILGLTVGVIQHDMTPDERQKAYACDIAYGTNNEFGFDYLRDNMVIDKNDMVQRVHAFAVVDEVDSILIDEARTPLIISGPAEESTDKYYRANEIAKQLKGRRITEKEEIEAKMSGTDLSVGFDYAADEKARSISLSEAGEAKTARLFGVASLHDMETIEYRHHILQALKAKEFFRIDVDYVVRNGEVIIVDEFTGRLMPGRRWSDGLHQAVEAKEGIKIERENQTLATITLQNYFRMYDKLSGMTGTAYTEANEFKEIYDLDCVVIPTNRLLRRTNFPDSIYKTVKEKFKAVVEEISELYEKGRPVLVGTISIEKSEMLSSLLKTRGIPHQVLNAKYHEREAHIVAQAGRFKGVTIATNMAGRGTDILLGGNAEHLAKALMEEKTREEKESPEIDAQQALYKKFIEQFKQQVAEEHRKVVTVGGLHVIGTERHESRRIDNQLRGRSGRQGDPGSSRFYVSLEDDLMRLFGSDRMMGIMERLGMEEDQVIEHPLITKSLEIAQKRVEGHNFEIRKQLLQFDNVMNKQREVIYSLRRSVLEGEDIKEKMLQAIESLAGALIDRFLSSEGPEVQWDYPGFAFYLKSKFGFQLEAFEKLQGLSKDEIEKIVLDGLLLSYEEKEKAIGSAQLRELERMLLLSTIDTKWKEHLYGMDQLKEGVGLRAYGQRDPLLEYQHEGFRMFEALVDSIFQEAAEMIFKLKPVEERERFKGVFTSLPQELIHKDFSSLSGQPSRSSADSQNFDNEPAVPQAPKTQPVMRADDKVGRNDPCPCGSGKKYKKCCGK